MSPFTHQFEKLHDIPDLVPTGLLLPAEQTNLRVSQEPKHTALTTSPIEVGHILFDEPPKWLYHFKRRLENHLELGDKSEVFIGDHWMNHCGRVVVRVALDPDRYSPINMPRVFDEEFSMHRNGQRTLFEKFIEQYGLYPRTEG